MDANALLADTWNNDLDPEVNAQLVQANVQAYFSVGKEKGKGKGMREFLSCTQRHHRIDATTSTLQRRTGEPTFVDPCPSGCKEFSRQGSKVHFVRLTCKICGTVRKERHPPRQDPASCSHRHTGAQREQRTHEKDMSRRSWNFLLILFRVRSTTFTRQNVQHHHQTVTEGS